MIDLTKYIKHNYKDSILEFLTQDINMEIEDESVVMLSYKVPRLGTAYVLYVDKDNAVKVRDAVHGWWFKNSIGGLRDIYGDMFNCVEHLDSKNKYVRICIRRHEWNIAVVDEDRLIEEMNDKTSFDIEVHGSIEWSDFVKYAKTNKTIKNPIKQ